MKGDCTLFIWSILYQVQKGISAKETIVEKLKAKKWIQIQTQKSPPSAFSANLKMSVFLISYYEIQDGIFPLSHSWPIHLRSLVGDGAIVCSCRSPCVAKSLSPEYSWWISIDREDWRNHCEIIFLTIRNDLLQGQDKNRNDFIKMTILSWIGHLSGCRKTPMVWHFVAKIVNRNMQILNLFCWSFISPNAWYDNVWPLGYNLEMENGKSGVSEGGDRMIPLRLLRLLYTIDIHKKGPTTP